MNLGPFPFLSFRVTLRSSSHSFQMVSISTLGTLSIVFILTIDAVASEDEIGWNAHLGLSRHHEEAIDRINGLDPYVPSGSNGPYYRRAMKPSPKTDYKFSRKRFNKFAPWLQALIDPKVPGLIFVVLLSDYNCKIALIVEPTWPFTF